MLVLYVVKQLLEPPEYVEVIYQRGRRVKRKKIPNWLIALVIIKSKFTCVSCSGNRGCNKAEIDHLVAVEDGGKDTLKNLQLLCLLCHSDKSYTQRHKL